MSPWRATSDEIKEVKSPRLALMESSSLSPAQSVSNGFEGTQDVSGSPPGLRTLGPVTTPHDNPFAEIQHRGPTQSAAQSSIARPRAFSELPSQSVRTVQQEQEQEPTPAPSLDSVDQDNGISEDELSALFPELAATAERIKQKRVDMANKKRKAEELEKASKPWKTISDWLLTSMTRAMRSVKATFETKCAGS